MTNEFINDFDKALELAKMSGKPILLNFHATWCGPCKTLKKTVFDSDTFKKESVNWILVRVDVDRQKSLASKFGASSIPHTFFLNSKGEQVMDKLGSMSLSAFMNLMKEAKSKM